MTARRPRWPGPDDIRGAVAVEVAQRDATPPPVEPAIGTEGSDFRWLSVVDANLGATPMSEPTAKLQGAETPVAPDCSPWSGPPAKHPSGAARPGAAGQGAS